MKNSDLNKLVSEYIEIKQKQTKKYVNSYKLTQKIEELEHRYFHETGRNLKSDLKKFR